MDQRFTDSSLQYTALFLYGLRQHPANFKRGAKGPKGKIEKKAIAKSPDCEIALALCPQEKSWRKEEGERPAKPLARCLARETGFFGKKWPFSQKMVIFWRFSIQKPSISRKYSVFPYIYTQKPPFCPKNRIFWPKNAQKYANLGIFSRKTWQKSRISVKFFPFLPPETPQFLVFLMFFVLFASKIDAFFFHFHRLAKMP